MEKRGSFDFNHSLGCFYPNRYVNRLLGRVSSSWSCHYLSYGWVPSPHILALGSVYVGHGSTIRFVGRWISFLDSLFFPGWLFWQMESINMPGVFQEAGDADFENSLFIMRLQKPRNLPHILIRSWLFLYQGCLTLSYLWVWHPHLWPQPLALVGLELLGKIGSICWRV